MNLARFSLFFTQHRGQALASSSLRSSIPKGNRRVKMKTAFTPTRAQRVLLGSCRPGALHPVAGDGDTAGQGGGDYYTRTDNSKNYD